MALVYWDTMLFVYLLEGGAASGRVSAIRKSMQERGDRLCTAVFTLGELLVRPYRLGATKQAEQARAALRPPWVELIGMDAITADHYARIRAQHRVEPPDAIHLASAARAGTNLFLTNDRALTRLRIPGIDFIAPLTTELF